MIKEPKIIHPKTIKGWHTWLEKNHEKESKVTVLKFKVHTGKKSISSSDAMDEAICWGWIDTIIKRIDEDIWAQNFSIRTKKSRWSKNTVARARRMIKAGRMQPSGMKALKAGLKRPLINLDLPKNPNPSEDLIKALNKSKKAKDFFKALAPSYKRFYIYWVERAVRQETRDKRIKVIVANCKQGKKQ